MYSKLLPYFCVFLFSIGNLMGQSFSTETDTLFTLPNTQKKTKRPLVFDVNKDSLPDYLTVDFSAIPKAYLMLNKGRGEFSLAQTYEIENNWTYRDSRVSEDDIIGFYDIDNDEQLELLLNHSYYELDSLFAPIERIEYPNFGFYGTLIGAVADLNGDGWLDGISSAETKDLEIYYSDSTGIFSTEVAIHSKRSYDNNLNYNLKAFVEDINNDGWVDFIMPVESNDEGPVVYFNDQGDSLRRVAFNYTGNLRGSKGATSIYLNDIDGDGDKDLQFNFLRRDIFEKNGTGKLFTLISQNGEIVDSLVSTSLSESFNERPAFINDDGYIDLVIQMGDEVGYTLNQGDFTFGVKIALGPGELAQADMRDIDGDGDKELTVYSIVDNFGDENDYVIQFENKLINQLDTCQSSEAIKLCQGDTLTWFNQMAFSDTLLINTSIVQDSCVLIETLNVSLTSIPTIKLFTDTTISIGAIIELAPHLEGSDSLIWSDGSQDTVFVFNSSDYGIGTHSIKISSFNNLGCSQVETITINVMPSTNTKKIKKFDEIKVFPNPTSDFIVLIHKEKKLRLEQVEIISQTGKLIFNQQNINSNTYKISMKHLTNGMFFIKIRDNEGNVSIQKIIKSN